MPMKRSRSSTSRSESGVSSSSDQGPSKRTRDNTASQILVTRESSVDQNPLRVYIISAKLSSVALENLVGLVEKSAAQQGNRVGARRLALTADSNRADVLVTAVHTRPRLERHVRWEVAKTKAIVTPDWLMESVQSGTIQPCGKYAALGDIRDETDSTAKRGTPAPTESSPNNLGQLPVFTDPEASVREADLAALNHFSSFSCQRASPLTCPNQALVEELDIIRRARLYEGEERSMMSYARAIAVSSMTSRNEIAKLPYLGTKLTSMVEEFVKTGKIQEAQKFLSSSRFQTLSAFNSIHGIGSTTARHLYSLGLRTIEDLEKYYEVTPMDTHEGIAFYLETGTKEISVDKSIKVSLALRHDFSQKIPRSESDEINQVIMRELESIEAGCKSILVGGYRRGKLESNDVDIIISHADWDHGAEKVRGLCKKLLQRLHERGLVTHVLNMSGYHPHNVFRTHHWDSLEKALTVFVLPNHSARTQTYRRVDLIFATPGVFWTAVVGCTRRHDSQRFHPKSERDVFELLGLAYVHPTLRNADA
ncbi:hypothetical protein V8E55_008929 [Tylopilus felleus]